MPLVHYDFKSISIYISGSEYEITHEMIKDSFSRVDARVLSDIPPFMRRKVMELLKLGNMERASLELEKMGLSRIGLQLQLFDEQPRGLKKELKEKIEQIQRATDSQILYLPTYRRIERELGSIFEGLDQDDFRKQRNRINISDTDRSCIELVEFGMRDVEVAINSSLEKLKDFARENLTNLTLRYLGAVVNREYMAVGMKEIAETSEEIIKNVLNRIPEGILNKEHKDHLFSGINLARASDSPDDHSKIICHYFLKLMSFQENLQQREGRISKFCELCSEYIVDKKFVYDSTDFSFKISPIGNARKSDIALSDLSSGEKQIVSLFSHLYLSGNKKYFVLIDEPELSLSVPWQRRFLADIRRGVFCAGLVAVTHSPFIYENDLEKYAHSLEKFITIS